MAEIVCEDISQNAMDLSSVEAHVNATAAPSFTAPVAPLSNYTVFLNHRGPDVKKGFVGHLVSSLESVGVRCFVDYKDLHPGDHCWDAIESAIRHSKVHIAIFSPGYASSTWCLRELLEILECRSNGYSQLFLPVFFGVAPNNLRHSSSPESCYYEAFVELLGRNDQQVVLNWRNALHQASMISGLTLDTAQGFEARLVKLIVSQVLDVLNRTLLDIAKHPVGVDEKLQEALNIMEIHNAKWGLRKLGIYGMGGVGKTTLAKSIYNCIYRDFDGFCFVESVSSKSKTLEGLEGVQKRILSDILKEKATIDVSSTSHGKQIMRDRFQGLKILVILDDIDDRNQLYALLSPLETCELKDGSQVVITTRDQQIVIWANAQQMSMDGLSDAHAHMLFNWHAFLHAEVPHKDLVALAKKVVDACQGLPLALETLGAHLYDKGIAFWKDTVKVLEGHRRTLTLAQMEVTSILRVSYDGLGKEEQLMFLDVTCFMLGESVDRAKRIWCESDTAQLCLETLKFKSLVKLDKDGKLSMHDLLCDMGREIVDSSHNNLWQRSHLHNATDVRTVLQRGKGASELRAVHLVLGEQEKWNTKAFTGMDSLKFLVLRNGIKLTGNFDLFPKELRWFVWGFCTLKHLPRKLDLSKVAVLDLGWSSISSLSNGRTFENLRELSLEGCSSIRKLPDFRVCCTRLEVLDLSQCYNLESVPESISCLSSTLTHLNLSWCEKLRTLPDTLVCLLALKSLNLNDCSSLTRLPDALGQLTALENVGLNSLRSLVLLPQSVGKLTELSSLSIWDADSLKEIPYTIGNLRKLSSLSFYDCPLVAEFPAEITSLTNLVHLSGSGVTANLIENIGNFCKLQHLCLQQGKTLIRIPSSIGQLDELVSLDLWGCNISEEGLPEEISKVSSLRRLCLGDTPLSRLPDLHLLSELRSLKLTSCLNLREIAALPFSLQTLDMRHCEELREIAALPPSLEELDISYCPRLMRLPSLCCLRKLRKLVTCGCDGLQKLQGLEGLSCVEILDAHGCVGMSVEVSQLAGLTALKELDLWGTGASLGPWIKNLVSLERITLDGETLPDCFSTYKEVAQVPSFKPRGCLDRFRCFRNDETQESYSWADYCITVPQTRGGMECKGFVICIAAPSGPAFALLRICEPGGKLNHEENLNYHVAGRSLQVLIRRSFVGWLKGGVTLSFSISPWEDEYKVLESDVAVRLVYEDHEFGLALAG